MTWSWLGPPMDVRPLFPVERGAFLDLLNTLTAEDWERATVCPGWAVRDVAGHVLHDQVRRLSADRDGHPGPAFEPGEALPGYLARTNEDFVRTARQLSPRLLVGLLDRLGQELDAMWAGRDLDAPAGLDVSWADPGAPAPTWLDVAREYTEYWVHQQQIRDAVGRPGADGPRLLRPVIDAFLRALPHTLRDAAAAPGTAVTVTVPGPAGGRWTAVRGAERWGLAPAAPDGGRAAAEVELAADTLWRLASRGIEPAVARTRARLRGDEALTGAVLEIVSIIR
ncbi:maleylpyruvate isomerase family mycothiol-dependent enzyme [Streptomyces sp. MP131-18]|uniref:maleylpyruvate isomerase family mycothiol-dependent enzyme n=1 Tax=Streptomyces sp. MP131-18 TaxID=1857892 RepID=UPI00097C2CB9|nr:maleylpyruvate isomerase family mycothiol-dependent enzyme [Streptomyces sp. MP131-18]ONK15648.1 putative Actinobacterial protein [Streptomyces sp. MP131-18]